MFRNMEPRDVEAVFEVRASTRENALTCAQLLEIGITAQTTINALESKAIVGRVCEVDGKIVGFCSGDIHSGEIIVLAVLPEFEKRKIGIALLNGVISDLSVLGVVKFWLACSPNPVIRSHGFYRANGWIPTGEILENQDEILVLQTDCRNFGKIN